MIAGLDHVVIVVRDFETALAFYTGVLGCEPLGVEDWRQGRRRFPSLRAGRTMINVHQEGRPVGLDAKTMQAGRKTSASNGAARSRALSSGSGLTASRSRWDRSSASGRGAARARRSTSAIPTAISSSS